MSAVAAIEEIKSARFYASLARGRPVRLADATHLERDLPVRVPAE